MRIKILSFCLFTALTFLLTTTVLGQATDGSAFTISDTVLAKQLLTAATKLRTDRKFEDAHIKLDSAGLIYSKILGEKSLEYGRVLANKGVVFYHESKFSSAIEYLEKSLQIYLIKLGVEHDIVAQVYSNLGNAYQSISNYKTAIQYFEKRLQIELKPGRNRSMLPYIYNALGTAHFYNGNYDKVQEYYDKALNTILKEFDDSHPATSICYRNLGIIYSIKGDSDKAIQFKEKAIEIDIKQYGETNAQVASSYISLAVDYAQLKYDIVLAIKYTEKALQIRENIFGRESIEAADCYAVLSNYYSDKDEVDKAVNLGEKAMTYYLNILGENHTKVVETYLGIAVINMKAGDYYKAKQYLDKALDIGTKLFGEDHPLISDCLNNIGRFYKNTKNYEVAIEYFKKNNEMDIKYYGEKKYSLASSYDGIGECYRALKRYDQGSEFLEKSLQLLQNSVGENHPWTAIAYHNLAYLYSDKGDYNHAIVLLDKALQINKILFGENNTSIVGDYIDLGKNYILKKEYNQAIYFLQKALEANQFKETNFQESLDLQKLINTFYSFTSNYLSRYQEYKEYSDLVKAKENIYDSFKAINLKQNTFSETSSKEFFTQITQPVYESAILTNQLLHQHTKDISLLQESFTFAERSKAFLLYGALQESNALQFSGLPEDLLQQEYDLRVDITYNEKRRQELISKGASETDTTVLAISGKLFDLKQGYETLKKRFETVYPEYYRLKYDLSTISAEDVQRNLLQPNQALLEYFVGDSSIFVFVIRPDTLVVQEVKKDFPLEDWVKSLRENIYLNRTTGAVAYAEAAYNLYQKLIAPVKSLLPEQVIIIPDGILGYVPFEALLTAKPERAIRFNTHAYLLKEHQISYCYSATLLREMQQKKSLKTPTGTLLAVAPFYSGDTTLLANLFAYDETTRKDLAPLQHSGEEVYRISKLWKGEVLTGADATEEKFTLQAGNYKILHLATHGRADERVGDYSFLAFSEIKDSMENELLYVRDLYNMQLNADLVVLSACETGLGKLSRGEGIISLARAFAYAGAKSIVTTLWSVDDAKTKDVMVEFYRKLKKGMTKAAALRQAKLDYLESHTNPGDAHPYYWAGFASIGDMRALPK